MWTMEDVLSELRDDQEEMKNEKGRNGLPPGFRFHPTDEELVTFYLASKVFYNHNITTPVHIAEVDLNRCEPWDLPERAKMGEREWYLYSLRDRKYPTGLRTNRATGSGYWKATGKDRQVYAANIGSATGTAGDGSSGMLIGMKKTLVFYQGRAPRGVKTRWVMHEYRLDGHFSSFRLSSKEEWVICRIFHKHGGEQKKTSFQLQPPLSPFLRCLPPLLDFPTNSSSSSTTQSLQNSSSNNKSHNFPTNNNNNNHSNFLLQSLLSNPLPNFSSLVDDHNTQFTATNPAFQTINNTSTTTATATAFNPFYNPVSDRICQTGIDVSKQNRNVEQYQNCMNKICQSDNNQYDDENEEDDVTVHFDMSSSVAALDRLLNPHHINFSAESWSFHP